MVYDTPTLHSITPTHNVFAIKDIVTGENFLVRERRKTIDQLVPVASGCHDCSAKKSCPMFENGGRCKGWVSEMNLNPSDYFDF